MPRYVAVQYQFFLSTGIANVVYRVLPIKVTDTESYPNFLAQCLHLSIIWLLKTVFSFND